MARAMSWGGVLGVVSACAVATGCTTTAYLQGAPGPMASPKAAATVDLSDDLYIRAVRIATFDGRIDQLHEFEKKVFSESIGTRQSYAAYCLSNLETEYESDSDVLGVKLDLRFNPNRSGGMVTQRERSCLNEAGQLFRFAIRNLPEADRRVERTEVQEKLVRASEVGCSLYKKYLNSVQSDNNLWLGTATTLFAAAATIVSSPMAAKNWAGAAAMASGTRAEFNADAFNSNAAYVIAKAIDKDRETALISLRAKQALPFDQYPIEAAVADSLGYHDRCSLYRGIQALDESITIVKDPGLRHIKEFIKQGTITVNQDGSVSAANVRVGALIPPDPPATMGAAGDGVSDAYLRAVTDLLTGSSRLEEQRKTLAEELTAFVADTTACPADPCKKELQPLLDSIKADPADAAKCPVLKDKYLTVFYTGEKGLSKAGCFKAGPMSVGGGTLVEGTCAPESKRIDVDKDLFGARVALEEGTRAKLDDLRVRQLRDALELQRARASAFYLEQVKPVMNVYGNCRTKQDAALKEAKDKLQARKKLTS